MSIERVWIERELAAIERARTEALRGFVRGSLGALCDYCENMAALSASIGDAGAREAYLKVAQKLKSLAESLAEPEAMTL